MKATICSFHVFPRYTLLLQNCVLQTVHNHHCTSPSQILHWNSQMWNSGHLRSSREGNGLADFVANLAFENSSTVSFHGFGALPSRGKVVINLAIKKGFRLRSDSMFILKPDLSIYSSCLKTSKSPEEDDRSFTFPISFLINRCPIGTIFRFDSL